MLLKKHMHTNIYVRSCWWVYMHAWVLAQIGAVHPHNTFSWLSVTALKPIPRPYCLSYHNITFLLICPVCFNPFYVVSAKSHGSEFCNLNTYFISFVCPLFLEASFLKILSISHSDTRKNSWFLLSIHFLYTFILLLCSSHSCLFYLPNRRVHFSSYRSNLSCGRDDWPSLHTHTYFCHPAVP